MGAADSYRQLVTARAGGACEYCRLLQNASGVTFHIEHVIPQSRGGATLLSNLALSCPGCNLAKSSRLAASDDMGELRQFFNPRNYDPWLLGWYLHFTMDFETGRIVPRTPTGIVTVAALQMNSATRTFARKLQIAAGLLR